MARRRSAAGWSTKTYKGPLWKVFHPGKYLRSEYRKAKRAMHPGKVFLRVTSLDEVVKLGRTTTTRVNASTRQADLQRAQKKTAAAQKKTAAKKTAKRADPYAAARQIPGRNRAAAAKMVKATQPPKGARTAKRTGASVVPVRNPDGTFNGSKTVPTFGPAEQSANTRAWQGYVAPELLPKNARTRRR